jgi:hypothetical protein
MATTALQFTIPCLKISETFILNQLTYLFSEQAVATSQKKKGNH